MFDTIVIEGLKLPRLPQDITVFLKQHDAVLPADLQTKDLENALLTYHINATGQIFEMHYVPTGQKKPYEPLRWSFQDNRSALERLYHHIKYRKLDRSLPKYVEEKKPVKKKSKLTATFTAGGYHEVAGRYIDTEYEFVATQGKVTSIKLLSAQLESAKTAAERHARDDEFKAKMDASFVARKKLTSAWYYPVIKETYNPFVFFSKIIIQAACNKIVNWTYRWHGI